MVGGGKKRKKEKKKASIRVFLKQKKVECSDTMSE
jgi:hypothetical protein